MMNRFACLNTFHDQGVHMFTALVGMFGVTAAVIIAVIFFVVVIANKLGNKN